MSKRTGILPAILLCMTGQLTHAFDSAAYKQFQSRISPTEGVFAELSKFSSGGEVLPPVYQDKFVASLSNKVFAEKARAMKELDLACEEYVKVDFSNAISDPQDTTTTAAVQDFESGLIRIETSACFKNSSPSEVLAVFSNPLFQKEAISTIVSSEKKGSSVCEMTSVMSIGKSHYCYVPETYSSETLALNHHFNSWNGESGRLVPVYFREILTSAHRTPNGVAFHMVAYIRSVKLGPVKKVFAKTSIETEQANSMALLKTKLNDH